MSEGTPAGQQQLKAVLEALMFISEDPLPLAEALQVTGGTEESLRQAIEELRADYDAGGRGLRIEQVAGGLRLTTRPEIAPFLHKFSRLRHRRRLSGAALETLAVVAYRQPITAPEIQEIRGVNPEGALKTLLERRLVRISGRKKVVGRPLLYSTTREFLVHFGLDNLDELPAIEEFEKILQAAAAREAAREFDTAPEETGAQDAMADGGEEE